MPNIIHVVGTGTIGAPLIGLLSDHKEALGLDEVTFHKRTPLAHERAKIDNLVSRGAALCVDDDRFDEFVSIGHKPVLRKLEAIRRASVVIDCTPAGNDNKQLYSSPLGEGVVGFLAQGSEDGFGKPYAYGINDEALSDDRYVQVVSCNTHNMSSLVKAIAFHDGARHLVAGNFVCMRRANDISQDDSFIASPEVSRHDDKDFGTHHAHDVNRVFSTMGHSLNVFSSSIKLNTQYMHSIWFRIELDHEASKEEVLSRLSASRHIAMTHHKCANMVFSFGRDHGYYGRILNHTVVVRSSMAVKGREVFGFCFTPQDGNSILSSVAAAVRFVHPDYQERLKCLDKYLFAEI